MSWNRVFYSNIRMIIREGLRRKENDMKIKGKKAIFSIAMIAILSCTACGTKQESAEQLTGSLSDIMSGIMRMRICRMISGKVWSFLKHLN